MAITGHVALLIFNFKEGIIHGVLTLIIPFYAPVYGALRNQGFWAFLWLLGNVFVGLGFGMTVWFKGGNADPGAVWLTPATKSELTAFAPASILRAEPHT